MIAAKFILAYLIYKIVLFFPVYYLFRNSGIRVHIIELIYDTRLNESKFNNKLRTRVKGVINSKVFIFVYSESTLKYLLENNSLDYLLPIDIRKEFNSDNKKANIINKNRRY